MTDSIDGIDRRLTRYRQTTTLQQILQHQTPQTPNNHTPLPSPNRETPDASQVIGIPLFVMRTPSWNRQDWAEPQHPPTVPTRKEPNA